MFSKDLDRKNVYFGFEYFLTFLCLLLTLVGSIYLTFKMSELLLRYWDQGAFFSGVICTLQLVFLLFVFYANGVYLLSRAAFFYRFKRHKRISDKKLQSLWSDKCPTLTLLIPSYKEEISVIQKSLLSSLLQDFPNRDVVLLIDDPANPKDHNDHISLENTKNLVQDLNQEFIQLAAPYKEEYNLYLNRQSTGLIVLQDEKLRLSQLYEKAAQWFKEQHKNHPISDHTDGVFVKLIYSERSKLLAKQSLQIRYAGISRQMIERAYYHLSTIFSAKVTFFERKQYQNLSQALNKAMNVNSYLGLMGNTYSESFSKDGLILKENFNGNFTFDDADYIAMLDADSVLSFDYSKRLIYEMEQKEKIAVIQTPPTAFPNPVSKVEEVAGATMDMQYYSQQGYTQFNATYWVGANAISRKKNLDTIVERYEERGYTILRYIQDRTVIEDTESSIDLVDKGWSLSNYPERLSYSSTPPDFGSLLIQRRRWANGGVIIIPKLLRYFFKRPFTLKKAGESIIRFGYLSSVAMWIIGVCLLSIFPLENELMTVWFFVTLLPYLMAYARDLKITGFKYSDIWRVMALNTLLIPVNAAGVMKSIQQVVTGKQIPFFRTPKIQGRTSVPRFYLVIEFLMCFLGAHSVIYHSITCQWSKVFMSGLFFIQMVYGIYCFLGIRNCIEDIMPTPGNKRIKWHEILE